MLWLLLAAGVMSNETLSSPIRVIAGSIALALVVVGCACVSLGHRRLLNWQRPAAIVVTVSLGLLLSAPVPIEWRDGCNYHLGTTYVVTAPYVLIERPAETPS